MKSKESSKSYNWGKGAGNFSSTFPNYIRIFLVLCVLLLVISLLPIKVLMTVDYKTGDYIKAWRVKDDQAFHILYTHSVQLTPVTEKYKIKGEKIVLTDAFFHSLGAGLPATTPYKFRLKEDGFEIYDINQEFEDFIYRTGAERANHRLIFEDSEYDFLDFSKPRTGVKFQVEKMSILSFIIKEGF